MGPGPAAESGPQHELWVGTTGLFVPQGHPQSSPGQRPGFLRPTMMSPERAAHGDEVVPHLQGLVALRRKHPVRCLWLDGFRPSACEVEAPVEAKKSWTIAAFPRLRFLPFLFALLLAALPCSAQSLTVNRVTPLGLKTGAATVLTLEGSGLAGATNLWLSVPATIRALTNSSSRSQFEVTLAKDLTPQVAAVRLAGEAGAAALFTVLVDDIGTATRSTTNTSPAKASLLTTPIAVEGNAEENASAYYAFDLKKGERLSFEVFGARLGSQIDSLIRILDARGRERAYAEDDPVGGTDSRLSFIAPETGRFTAEVRDTAWAGGDRMFYRMRVGQFPLAKSPFPLSGDSGKKLTATLAGDGMEESRIDLIMPDAAGTTPIASLAAKGRRSGQSGIVSIPVGNLPIQVEEEPNNSSNNATRIAWPSLIQGRFQKPADVDWYEFTARSGDKIVFTGRTRSVGSGCDLSIELLDSSGKRLAATKPAAADEGVFTNRFAASGTYRLKVEELNRFGGSGFSYQIDMERASPIMVVRVEGDLVEVAAGGTNTLKVSAKRTDYDGPIRFEVARPVPGIQVTGQIAATMEDGEITVSVDAPLVPGQLRVIRLRALSDEKTGLKVGVITARTSATAATKKKPKPAPTTTFIGWHETLTVSIIRAAAKP